MAFGESDSDEKLEAIFNIELDGLGNEDINSFFYLTHYLKRDSIRSIGEPTVTGAKKMKLDAYNNHENLAHLLKMMGADVVKEGTIITETYKGEREFFNYNVSFSNRNQ